MLKYLFAVLAIPFTILWYVLEAGCRLVSNVADDLVEGAYISMDWIDKLPFPK